MGVAKKALITKKEEHIMMPDPSLEEPRTRLRKLLLQPG